MPIIRPVRRAGAFLIPIALVLAACGGGGGASGSPTAAAPDGTSVTTATPTPAASTGAVASQPPDASILPIPSFDLGTITEGLANLDSYRVTITSNGEETYKGVVVTKPVLSRDVTIQGGTRIVVIGSDAWVAQGAGPLTKVPESMATGLFAAFDPTLLVGAFSGQQWAQSSLEVGDEQKNGVNATHYRIDSSTATGGLAGVPPGAAIDVWIADEGYLVAWESTGFAGTQNFSIQVTNVDDPANKVETPS